MGGNGALAGEFYPLESGEVELLWQRQLENREVVQERCDAAQGQLLGCFVRLKHDQGTSLVMLLVVLEPHVDELQSCRQLANVVLIRDIPRGKKAGKTGLRVLFFQGLLEDRL